MKFSLFFIIGIWKFATGDCCARRGSPQLIVVLVFLIIQSILIQARRRAAGGGGAPGANIPKSMFYEQKYDFWLIGTRFDLFKGTPKLIFFLFCFVKHKIYFIYCHIEPICQKFGTYSEKCDVWLVRALFALFLPPPPSLNSSKTEIFKNDIFCCFPLSHWAYLPKITFLQPKVWILAPWAPFAFFKRAPNSSKTEIFENNNFFCFILSHWAYLPKIMFLSSKRRPLAL